MPTKKAHSPARVTGSQVAALARVDAAVVSKILKEDSKIIVDISKQL